MSTKQYKLLFVVTEDWYFCSHRLDLARTAQNAGYEVVVATRVTNHGETIRKAGFRLVDLGMDRSSKNPLVELRSLLRLIRIFYRENPDLIHLVAVKPVLYGALAAIFKPRAALVGTLAGMGWLFASDQGIKLWIKKLFLTLLGTFFRGTNNRLILQNQEDFSLFESRFPQQSAKISLIRGSGVHTDLFPIHPEPEGVVTIALISRMLWDKGVGDMVEAAKILQAQKVPVRMVLVGGSDPENPNSIPETTLQQWHDSGTIEWWGHRSDISAIWATVHIAALPSFYGEGLPKSLLEAGSCGRPTIATDWPGCRELIIHEQNGLLVPPKNPTALAEAITRLVNDQPLRQRLGATARKMVEDNFSHTIVNSAYLNQYKEALGLEPDKSGADHE